MHMVLLRARLDARLKSAIGRQHQEGWRFERVLRRQQDAAMIDATLHGETRELAKEARVPAMACSFI
jgi:hypothetical protein